MEPMLYFQSIEYLEPKCPHCGTKLDYGENTRYVDELGGHICLNCNKKI